MCSPRATAADRSLPRASGHFGNYDSSSYDGMSNSRYTIAVTGVDHDGQYINADGTFTSYPEAGAERFGSGADRIEWCAERRERQRVRQRYLDDRPGRRLWL